MEERTATVRAIEKLAPDVHRIVLEPAAPPEMPFRAGQFVSLRIGNGYHPRRSYSIASSPERRDSFELLVKNIGKTAKGFFSRLSAGDSVSMNGPMGFFTLCDDHPGDVVLAATGVGISAILAQIHELLGQGGDRKVELYWGFGDAAEVFGQELLEPLAADPRFSSHLYVAEPDPSWQGRTGFITGDVVATAGRLREPTYYLCGNGDMVADVQRGLSARGVPRERVRTEVFYPRVSS